MIQPSLSKIAEDEVEGTDDVPGRFVPRKSTRTSVLRKSIRTRKAKSYGSDFQLYFVEGTRDKTLSQRKYCFIIEEDPRTLSEAMASRDVAFRKEAIQSEIDFIMYNDTWELTDLPPGCKTLGCKWILKRKMKVDGSIDKYKAKLVIQGFRQKEGINFFDTYAPIAMISTIRLLLALAAINDLVIHQMDVKATFLNGDLDEKIYMKQPGGFVMSGHESKLTSVYSKFDASGKRVIICLHVDDMLIFGTDQYQLNKIKEFLSSKFDMKDLGEAEVILGYSDTSWINNMEDHLSTSGWVFLLRRDTISWASKKQTCITSLTMEFEFVALAVAGNEAEWLRNLVFEIPLWPKLIFTISIKCDSAATLAKAYSQVYNADHLTKGLARDLVRKAAIWMGLEST
nr:zinc finger, CCHC-type [Tanacetum cinerariifolium]